MGSQFRYPNNNLSQQSPVNHEQLYWVPRSLDMWGGGAQGGHLVMSVFGEDVLFDTLAIADTAAHMSAAISTSNPTGASFDQVYAPYKTGLFTSTLNQSVSLQPMWSRDMGATWYSFGTPVTINAYSGAGTAESGLIALSVPAQYVPFVGVQATCTTAPTSGVLSGWLERLG